jgi:hypothetical protein
LETFVRLAIAHRAYALPAAPICKSALGHPRNFGYIASAAASPLKAGLMWLVTNRREGPFADSANIVVRSRWEHGAAPEF